MTALSVRKNPRIGELLVHKGVATPDQIEIALLEQKKSGEVLGKIMVRLGFATEAIIRDVIGGALGQKSADLNRAVADSEAIALVPKELARRLKVLPVHFDAGRRRLTVAMADTLDVVALDQLNAHLAGAAEIAPLLAGEAEIEKAIDRFYGFELSVDGILHEIETGEIDRQSLEAETDAYSQPVTRLVNALLSDAVKRGASDVHFEPEEGFLRFRYRIDGVLRQIRSLHKNYWAAIAVRLKVMAGMDIAEARAPQDGRVSLSLSGRRVDFRVSTLPTVHGENIVLRVLDRQLGIVPLEGLGLRESELAALKQTLIRPEGIVLVTGPTGSGKTTTLYSILNHLNTESVNIMTLEDPVEYPLAMIRQTSANESPRLGFADGIRSMMRQDPDIILVGEIRDQATAGMALRAAMTGHRVFSTLHTNSALGAVPRLLDIGLQAEILAGNIIAVVGQRLARKLCPACKQRRGMSRREGRLLEPYIPDGERCFVYRPGGCAACDRQGYRGRLALIEVLIFDHDLDELVAGRGSPRELRRIAEAKGFRSLADAGFARVVEGVTSLEEVARVVDLSARLRRIG